MAFTLSKEQSQKWDEALDNARGEHEELVQAIERYNQASAQVRDAIQAYVDGYNQALTELKNVAEEISSEWREAFDDKSETWQEGDKGQEISEIIDGLENFDIEEFELSEWTTEQAPDASFIDDFEELKPQ